ncbi:PAS domain S-box protein [Tenuifilum thalassicum]|uniref:PAS domain S-box protein n=1 Tax=Tenuifilum thalassicum TaxID=2590900 RepID=A0A7D4C7D9_9BACT|nr:PAS domain S-box protein [Tenuifilum thalassicum]QKG78962.1 PAS domain S-box protein [Tenuifilum thalassicum]
MISYSSISTTNNQDVIRKKVLHAFLLGILFPLIAWTVDIVLQTKPITLGNILLIHSQNPMHWIIDLAPFVMAFYTWWVTTSNLRKILILEKELRQRDEDIEKNAQFAKLIGEGNYNAPFEIGGDDDILGKSLLLMRDNLLANQKKEAEQNWITKGKDEVSHILRLHHNLDELAYDVLVKLINYIRSIQGAIYLYDEEKDRLINLATYAYNRRKYIKQEFKIGEGLIGECAYERDYIYRTEIPDDYVTITSGILGDKKPKSLLLIPLITDEKLEGVLEFASLDDEIPELTIRFLKEVGEIIARTIFNLRINQKTERLLQEAQQMAQELRENEEELRQNAEEMRITQEELEISNAKLESKIQEVENAQKRLHSLLENASEIISIYNSDKQLTYISPSVTKILGYTPQEMMSGKDFDRLTRKGESAFNEMFEQLLENPRIAITIQYTFMKKDGEKIFLEVTGRNLLDDPAIGGIIINSRDITERKRAEKEERMRSKMQSLSENSPDIIMRVNPSGQFFYANPMVGKYLGINNNELINQTISVLDNIPELYNFIRDAIKTIRVEKENYEGEITFNTNLGETVMHIVAIPEFNENELETILFVAHDITDQKKTEREIQEKNRKITESINYAQRIQTSILPSNKIIRQYLPKSFIYYHPRDVVSGDFPWFFVKDDFIYIAAVDCTGHGVPGALLSFIGFFTLNNVVDHDSSYTAGQILDHLHYGVRKTLKQDRPDADARDGMDIAFCKIDPKSNELQYSGAHRPLYFVRNGELTQYKGDRKAIGGIPHPKKAEEPFTNYTITYKPGDRIFFFSDGIVDQVGGPIKKKFGAPAVREIIINNQNTPIQELHSVFENAVTEYQGDNKQVDDILLIGIEF